MIKSRKVANNIEKWLKEKEIIILSGVRQVGKTSLLHLMEERLIKGGISQENIIYLNLENIGILSALNENPENVFLYTTDRSNRNYFLIDEIQYLDNPSNFLKLLYDTYGEMIKFVVTGSSSLELKARFQDSLVGRKVSFEILPLDFEEYLSFIESPLLSALGRSNLSSELQDSFQKKLNDFLLYGGMPAVVLQSDPDKKRKLLNEYVSTYINKDIRAIGRIENIASFNNFIRVLAASIGNLLNISELASTVGIERRLLERYLDLLHGTFVLYRVLPFSANVRTRISKRPKTYFFDSGIRNAIIANFSELEARSDAGALFENFVYMEFLKNRSDEIYFFRTSAGSEVDFVFQSDMLTTLVEVKYKRLNKRIDERVIKNLLKEIGESGRAFVVNLSRNEEAKISYCDFRALTRLD
jgi:predicted AAA+ superfamily ATPase